MAVRAGGRLRAQALRAALAAHDMSRGLPLVAVHAANNETGVVQPVAEIAAMNILQASVLAMRRAVAALARRPALVLVDGHMVPPASLRQAPLLLHISTAP